MSTEPNGYIATLDVPYTQVPNSLLDDEGMGAIEMAVFCHLARYSGRPFPSMETLKKKCSRKPQEPVEGKPAAKGKPVSERAIKESIDVLASAGYVMKIRRGQMRSNFYVVDSRGGLNDIPRDEVIRRVKAQLQDGSDLDRAIGESIPTPKPDADKPAKTADQSISTNHDQSISTNHDQSISTDYKDLDQKDLDYKTPTQSNFETVDNPPGRYTKEMGEAAELFIEYMKTTTGETVGISKPGMRAICELFTSGPKGVAGKAPVTLGQFKRCLTYMASPECRHSVASPEAMYAKWLPMKQAKMKADARNGLSTAPVSGLGVDIPQGLDSYVQGQACRSGASVRPQPQSFQPAEEWEPDMDRTELSQRLKAMRGNLVGSVDAPSQ